ncbi:MAG: DUF4157 domain-containing protein [Bacteroidota bacterium]
MKASPSKLGNSPSAQPKKPFFAKQGDPFFSKPKDQKDPFFNKPSIQAKLSVSQPNDPYEQEADAVAEKVMRQPETGPNIQQMEHPEKETIQPKGNTPTTTVSANLQTQLNGTKGSDQALTESTNQFMSNAIGADFSDVRIHTDQNAIQMNQELNAKAFTYGSDIYFNQGEYQPNAEEGKRLLAHELTHVVQQKGNKASTKNRVHQKRIQRTVGSVQYGYLHTYGAVPVRRIAIQDRTLSQWRDFLRANGILQTSESTTQAGQVELIGYMALALGWQGLRMDEGLYIRGHIAAQPGPGMPADTRVRWNRLEGEVSPSNAVRLMVALLSTDGIDLPDMGTIDESGLGQNTMAAVLSLFIRRFAPLAIQTITNRSNAAGFGFIDQAWGARIREFMDESTGLRNSRGATNPANALVGAALGQAITGLLAATQMRLANSRARTMGQTALVYNAGFIAGGAIAGLSDREQRHRDMIKNSIKLVTSSSTLLIGNPVITHFVTNIQRFAIDPLLDAIVQADASSMQEAVIQAFNQVIQNLAGEVNGTQPVGFEEGRDSVEQGEVNQLEHEHFDVINLRFTQGMQHATPS